MIPQCSIFHIVLTRLNGVPLFEHFPWVVTTGGTVLPGGGPWCLRGVRSRQEQQAMEMGNAYITYTYTMFDSKGLTINVGMSMYMNYLNYQGTVY